MPNNPNVTINIVQQQQLAALTEQKVLMVGQLIDGVSGDLVENIGITGEEDALFGAKSHLAGMLRAGRTVNTVTTFDAIGLSDGAGTAATTIVTFTGTTATEDGTIIVTVGSGKNHKYAVPVIETDTPTLVGDALVTLITADSKAPFTAANVAGVVTITASNTGTLGNKYTVRYSGVVAGITTALTGWVGGATDPDLTTLFDVIENARYNTIIFPVSWDITVLSDFLDARFNVINNVLDGVGFVFDFDTLANLKANALVVNSNNTVYEGVKAKTTATQIGCSVVEFPDHMSAKIGSIRALRLTAGAPIGQILSTTAPRDSFGGASSSTLPYFNTLISGVELPSPGDMFSNTEENELEDNGVSVSGLNRANSAYIFGATVTTQTTDPAGNPITQYLNKRDSDSVVREYFFVNMKSNYAQSRLTNGSPQAGFAQENAISIRAFMYGLQQDLADIVVLESGAAAADDFKETLVLETNIQTGTVTFTATPLGVGQIRHILGTIQVPLGA